MKILLIVILIAIGVPAFAQGSSSIYERTTNLPKGKHFFVLPPNAYWNKQPWVDSVYLFPAFQPGKLEMKNGFTPSLEPMLNYNVFLDVVDIRPAEGQIFPLADVHDVKTIWIGDHKFIYVPSFGYMEIILEGKASVGEQTLMRAIYELSNGTKYPLSNTDVRTGISKGTRYYWIEKHYYIFTDSSRIYRSGSGVLPKFFPEQKGKIKSFVRGHKTDFKKKEDILEVVSFSNEL